MGGVIFWVLLAAALIVIEISTTQLVCIWFAVGALLAAFAALVGAPLLIQLIVFLVFSAAAFWIGRPLLIERIMPNQMESNTDRMIGIAGVVLEEIKGPAQPGRIEAGGLFWTAKSEDGSPIAVGSPVRTLRLDGITMIVKPLTEQENSSGASGAPNNESEV